jgi:glycosyltransferase involved in cell wall biosynthesis
MKIGYLLQEGVPDIRAKPLSGPANHVVSVIQELRKAGHQVSLLSRLNGKLYLSTDFDPFTWIEIRCLEGGLFKLIEKFVRRIQYELKLPYANLFESLRFAFACRQVLSDCDIYFERMGWLGYGGTIASQLQHIPLVLEVNGDHIDEFKSRGMVIRESQQRLSYFVMKQMAKNVTHVVASGEGWREKYIERWNVEPSRVTVVENGSSIIDLLKTEDLHNLKPISPEEPVQVVFCGGFEAWYGIPVLIRAVRRVVDFNCNLHVTLIGSGPEKNDILELIRDQELESEFTFTGQIDLNKLAYKLAQSHVGVAPYCNRVEFSGLKLLDYKAAGLATIVSGKEEQTSPIVHGRTGLIVTPCDVMALADAIIYLSENRQLINEMGKQARLEAEQSHRWINTTLKLEKLFASILAEESR